MITMFPKHEVADSVSTLNLINGEFSSDEAIELLSDLFQSKIDFQVAQNFSHEERFGLVKPKAIERIMALKKAKKEALKLVREKGGNVRIHSNVVLEFLNQND